MKIYCAQALPNTEFLSIHTLQELKAYIKFIMNFSFFEFDQFDLLQMITQLKIKEQRQVIQEDKMYLEIPNSDGLQQIFHSENYQMNKYLLYKHLGSALSPVFHKIKQARDSLQNIQVQVKFTPFQKGSNFLNIDFALKSQFSIEQSLIIEQDTNRNQQIFKLKLPMYCELLNLNLRTQFEGPMVGMIIE
ncbi:unnamed protein product [Paramecium octaurelia]|uniref:Uncharacterized protein n=1 Tax=Paramecium octaurelia TaxID=43137 RepID=A0A8S1YED0_PAROT|nr:unnamed protein product [Paramecium octaurelia]